MKDFLCVVIIFLISVAGGLAIVFAVSGNAELAGWFGGGSIALFLLFLLELREKQ